MYIDNVSEDNLLFFKVIFFYGKGTVIAIYLYETDIVRHNYGGPPTTLGNGQRIFIVNNLSLFF
jgi:hypothetical protein